MPRAAVMPAPRVPVEVRSLPEPELEPGAVLLETIFSEVCGTDVHLHHGRLEGVPYPIVPGHVSVGRIAEVRGSVADVEGRPIEPGRVVTFLDVHETCHACWACLVARTPNRCPRRKVYGITYGADEGPLGGWSETILLKPGVRIVPLPDAVPPERLIAAGCGLATALHAVDRARIRIGDTVAVQGTGPVGLGAVVLARLSGAGRVIAVGAPAVRLEAARAMGADATVPVDGTGPGERVALVREATAGRGADVVVEATGVPAAVAEGLDMVRDGGRYVVVGQYTDAGETPIHPHRHLTRKHVDLKGCWGFAYHHMHRMVGLLAREGERVGWERLISRVYGLEEANEALADVEAGRAVKAVIRPTPIQA